MTEEHTPDPGHEVAQALLEGVEAMAPLFEAAAGMKADLERRGWSTYVAEDVAYNWMIHIMGRIF